MNIRHIGIPVWDIEKELNYYLTMGLEVVSDTTESVRIVKMKDKKGMVLELLQYESQGPGREPHVAFTRDPEDKLVEIVDEHVISHASMAEYYSAVASDPNAEEV